MSRIHNITIKNFRSLKHFEAKFNSGIQCIIGRGDTGKTTILEAINYLLCPSYSLQFIDSDFYNCDTSHDIEISAVLVDLPDEIVKRHHTCICGLDESGNLRDDLASEDVLEATMALHIYLRVSKDLEPQWTVEARDNIENISANSRSKLGMIYINEYSDRHFTFSRGGFLYRRAKIDDELIDGHQDLYDIVRGAKTQINNSLADKFPNTIGKIISTAKSLGLHNIQIAPHIDARDLMVGEGSLSLSSNSIPLRRIGKGSRKIVSTAIQLSENGGGIILIDEIEVGLEPDRIINLINGLRNKPTAQVIMTTHSNTVLQELRYKEVLLKLSGVKNLVGFESSEQGLLRSNPSAFFAKRIIICEGRTEYGFIRAFEEYRRQNNRPSMSSCGVVIIDGNGAEMINKCNRLINLGYKCLLYCDNDVKDTNTKKEPLRKLDVTVVECEEGFCFEKQLFKDAPWSFVVEEIDCEPRHAEVTLKEMGDGLGGTWREHDSISIRNVVGMLSSQGVLNENRKAQDKSWYKNIADSEEMGNRYFKHYHEQNTDTVFYKNLQHIEAWIEDGY